MVLKHDTARSHEAVLKLRDGQVPERPVPRGRKQELAADPLEGQAISGMKKRAGVFTRCRTMSVRRT